MKLDNYNLVLVYSGGSDNQNPALSIGGEPSIYPIANNLHNLFNNISINDTFRCIYLFNNSHDVYDLKIYTENNENIELGFKFAHEIQEIKQQDIVTYYDIKNNYQIPFDQLEERLNKFAPGTKVVNNQIHFSDFKYHDLISQAKRIKVGSPINTIAQLIENDINPPIGIVFNKYNENNPVVLAKLETGDGLPIWIKRKYRKINADKHGFLIKIRGRI